MPFLVSKTHSHLQLCISENYLLNKHSKQFVPTLWSCYCAVTILCIVFRGLLLMLHYSTCPSKQHLWGATLGSASCPRTLPHELGFEPPTFYPSATAAPSLKWSVIDTLSTLILTNWRRRHGACWNESSRWNVTNLTVYPTLKSLVTINYKLDFCWTDEWISIDENDIVMYMFSRPAPIFNSRIKITMLPDFADWHPVMEKSTSDPDVRLRSHEETGNSDTIF